VTGDFSIQFIALYLSPMHLDPSVVMLSLRVTARMSAVLLACSFASQGLRRLWRSAFTLSMEENRHRLTLLFALSHTLHLAAIVALATLQPDQVFMRKNVPGLILGAMGYALIYYLAWGAFVARKTPDLPDSKIQTFGIYILWAVFTVAFTIGARRNALIYTPMALIMWFAFAVRMWARLSRYRSVLSPSR